MYYLGVIIVTPFTYWSNNMIFPNKIVALLFCSFFICACSSKHDLKITEVFKPEILDNGAKMFTFSLIFVNKSPTEKGRDQPQNKQKQGKGGHSDKQSRQTNNSIENQMTEELEQRLVDRLEENNYCRKGHFELTRTLNKSVYSIRGECSESATAEDRENYVN